MQGKGTQTKPTECNAVPMPNFIVMVSCFSVCARVYARSPPGGQSGQHLPQALSPLLNCAITRSLAP